jgi:hypothetical protein
MHVSALEVHIGVGLGGMNVGGSVLCRCLHGGMHVSVWEVHVVYLEEWWWEVLLSLFGGMVGRSCMWCIWRNDGGKCMSVCFVER